MSHQQGMRDAVTRLIAEIEAELRALGWWSETPPTAEQMAFTGAFGADTMTFAQWLQFILLDRLADVAAGRADLPPQSHLAPKAVREYDGAPEAENLIDRLLAVDDLVARRGPA